MNSLFFSVAIAVSMILVALGVSQGQVGQEAGAFLLLALPALAIGRMQPARPCRILRSRCA